MNPERLENLRKRNPHLDENTFNSFFGRGTPAKRNKYNAVKTLYNGVMYDSKGEAECAAKLDLLVKAGEYVEIERQVVVHIAGLTYCVDFKAIKADGDFDYIEYKGKELQRFKDQKKLWRLHMDKPLYIWKGDPPGLAEIVKVSDETI